MSGVEACPRCGARLPAGRLAACPGCLLAPAGEDPLALLAGALELEDELGRGGMGVVYRALDRRLGRRVAVKLLPPELAEDPERRARLSREARALARLNHPGIVQVHELGEEDGQPFIVMELVEGGSLADDAGGPWPEERALPLLRDVAAALAHAHAEGIVHRDVKPQNILVGPGGRAKVTDFGIARFARHEASAATLTGLTGPHAALGTPHYMAPEALHGAPADPRMDVYSLGVVAYRLLAGRLPAGDFRPLARPALDAVVRKALAPDPEDRPSMAELGEALARLLAEVEVERADPTGAPPRAAGAGAGAGANADAGAGAVDRPPGSREADRARAARDGERMRAEGAAGALAGARSIASASAPAAEPAPEGAAPDLDPAERAWLYAVALLLSLATSAALYAALVSLTPRVVDPGEVLPLTAAALERTASGELISRARFETGPVLAAVLCAAVALAGYGLLRRHWRRSGLERPEPERPTWGGRATLRLGLAALALYATHVLLERAGARGVLGYVPILGGAIELATLFTAWTAVLEAARTSRPLAGERRLLAGLVCAFVPPIRELHRALSEWAPPGP